MTVRQSKVGEHADNAMPSASVQAAVPITIRIRREREASPAGWRSSRKRPRGRRTKGRQEEIRAKRWKTRKTVRGMGAEDRTDGNGKLYYPLPARVLPRRRNGATIAAP